LSVTIPIQIKTPHITTLPIGSDVFQYHELTQNNDQESGSTLSGGNAIDPNNSSPVDGNFQFTNTYQYMVVSGTQSVSVDFVPSDTNAYNTVTFDISINVVPPAPASLEFNSNNQSYLFSLDSGFNIDNNDFTIEWQQYLISSDYDMQFYFLSENFGAYIDVSASQLNIILPSNIYTYPLDLENHFVGKWNYYVLSRKDGHITIFINGQILDSFANTDTIYNDDSPFFIGNVAGPYFNGYLYGFVYNNSVGLYDASNVPYFPTSLPATNPISIPAFNNNDYTAVLTGQAFGGSASRHHDILNNNVGLNGPVPIYYTPTTSNVYDASTMLSSENDNVNPHYITRSFNLPNSLDKITNNSLITRLKQYLTNQPQVVIITHA